jgi:hypothetical protein
MAVEAAILGRDHRLRQPRRHLFQGQRLAEQIAKGGDGAAVIGEDGDARPALGDCELIGVGQGEGEIGKRPAADDQPPQKYEKPKLEEAAENPAATAAPRRAARRRRIGTFAAPRTGARASV